MCALLDVSVQDSALTFATWNGRHLVVHLHCDCSVSTCHCHCHQHCVIHAAVLPPGSSCIWQKLTVFDKLVLWRDSVLCHVSSQIVSLYAAMMLLISLSLKDMHLHIYGCLFRLRESILAQGGDCMVLYCAGTGAL